MVHLILYDGGLSEVCSVFTTPGKITRAIIWTPSRFRNVTECRCHDLRKVRGGGKDCSSAGA